MLSTKEYNEAVDKWADDIYRFAYSCCKDGEQAKDAVQDAFTELWQSRDVVEQGKCKGFLIMVTQRKLRDAYRHEQVVKRANETMMRETELATMPSVNFDLCDALEWAMKQLPVQQKTILTLHDLEGYDYTEIASMMKIKYRAVQVNAFRARVKMKELLMRIGIKKPF